jgi:cyclophilin family peptidyl-prolyl cis-trans isomerase
MNPLRLIAFFGALSLWFCTRVVAADAPLGNGIYAEFTTPRGVITAELFFEKAPLTVANFVGLAEGTLGPEPRKPYFNGLTFHRVATGFVVQGGDPLGNGEGGPGYVFPDEFAPGLHHDSAGILSMANSGPDTNGSQFFFTLAPVNRLNYLHSVFGRTVRGLEILPQIKAGDTMTVKIIRRGSAAEKFQADDAAFAKLVAAIPRATPPAFDDVAGLLQTDPPRAKALDIKLKNFTRFTGVPLYARLYEKFEAASPRQKPAQFVSTLRDSLSFKDKGVLIVWFATEDDWHLVAPGYPDLKLPAIQPWPPLPPSSAGALEAVISDGRRRLLSALNEVIDGVIVQLEEKYLQTGASPKPSSP